LAFRPIEPRQQASGGSQLASFFVAAVKKYHGSARKDRIEMSKISEVYRHFGK
jgi:hypothetical protein